MTFPFHANPSRALHNHGGEQARDRAAQRRGAGADCLPPVSAGNLPRGSASLPRATQLGGPVGANDRPALLHPLERVGAIAAVVRAITPAVISRLS